MVNVTHQTPTPSRGGDAEVVATQLAVYAHRLARFLIKSGGGQRLSFTEAGLLQELTAGPRRVTDLAAREGLAQPTITMLVKRLEAEGLVDRVRQHDDQRVVLVSLTADGHQALDALRERATMLLRSYLDGLSGAQLRSLADATPALAELTDRLGRDARLG